jgi:hypothetical protein
MQGNNVEYAFITGRSISLDNKHKQLYRRFEAKYENIEQPKPSLSKPVKQPAALDK